MLLSLQRADLHKVFLDVCCKHPRDLDESLKDLDLLGASVCTKRHDSICESIPQGIFNNNQTGSDRQAVRDALLVAVAGQRRGVLIWYHLLRAGVSQLTQ